MIPKPRCRPDRRGRPWKPAREVLNAIVWILRTGAPWRALPRHYPSYQTCHRRFQAWAADGTFRRIAEHLARVVDVGRGDEAFIDGTYVPAKRGGDCVGRCRAGRATKVMVVADDRGLPLSIHIAEGSRHDVVLTDQTLDACLRRWLPPNLIGDKAWDSAKAQRSLAVERRIQLIAPKRGGRRPSRRIQDGRALRRARRRWKVERLISWFKAMRRLATRWEHRAANFLGMLELGVVIILLRQL